MATPYQNFWKGYRGKRTWGKWFVVFWPDSHPDTHCDKGKYVPGENKQCISCGWIPKRSSRYRDKIELDILQLFVAVVPYSGPMLPGYIAYVNTHRKTLTQTPDPDEVMVWWNSLKMEEKGNVLTKVLKVLKEISK